MVGQGVRALAYRLLRGQLLLQPRARPLIYLRTLTHIHVGVMDTHAEEQDDAGMPGSRPGGPLLLLPRAQPRIRLRWQDDPPQTVKARVGGRLFRGCTPSVLTYCSMRTWANSHEVNLFPASPVM